MATFINLNKGLTEKAVREVGSGASWQAATYFLDGAAPVSVRMDVAPEFLGALGPDGQALTNRDSVRFGNLLDHPEIADQVRGHEKAALLAKKSAGAINTRIQDRPSPDGTNPEWDHFSVTLSSEETAWLAANPEAEARFQEIVTAAMRSHPMAPGTRQALVTGIHKDSGDWHVQALVSRYAIDYSQQPPAVAPAVDVSNTSYMSKITRQMQDAFTAAGMPIVVTRTFKDAPETGAKSILEDRRTSDAAKEAYRADVAAAGGEPGARSTVGPVPETPATSRAIANIIPEIEKLERGAQLAEGDGLKAAQRVEQLQAELVAATAAREAAAERRATFDQAIAAIGQRAAAEAARDAADARAAADAHLRELAEQEAIRAAAKATEAERLATEAREHADTLAGELRTAADLAAGEPRRTQEAVSEAVAPVAAELNDVRDDLMRAQQHAEQMEARADALEAELREERRTFPERVAAAVTSAVADAKAEWDRTILQPLRDERDSFKHDVEAVRAELKAAKDAVAAVPGQIAAAVEKAVADAVQATKDQVEASVVKPMRDTLAATEAKVSEWMKSAQDAVARTLGLSERMEAQQAVHAGQLAEREAALSAERAASAADRERMEARLAALEARLAGPRQPPAPPADEPDALAPDAPPKPRGGGGGQGGGSAPSAPVAAASPSGRPAPSGRDFNSVPPAEWTDVQRAYAEKTLAANQAKGRAEGMDLATFGEAVHVKWKESQPQPSPDDEPEQTRKPR